MFWVLLFLAQWAEDASVSLNVHVYAWGVLICLCGSEFLWAGEIGSKRIHLVPIAISPNSVLEDALLRFWSQRLASFMHPCQFYLRTCGGVCTSVRASLCASLVAPQISCSIYLSLLLSVFLALFLFLWLPCDISLVKPATQQLLFPLTPSPIVPIYTLLSDQGHVQCHSNHTPSVPTKAVSLSHT